jgi:L-amino acid N-acyltransferase YncA
MNVSIEKICKDNITEKYVTKELVESQIPFSGYTYALKDIGCLDFWAILDDEKPIGFFCGSNHCRPHDALTDTGEVSDMASVEAYSILPEYKDKGIGALAYKELENYYRQMNCFYIYAAVNNDSDQVDCDKKFFKEMGFKVLCAVYFSNDNEDKERWRSIMVKNL